MANPQASGAEGRQPTFPGDRLPDARGGAEHRVGAPALGVDEPGLAVFDDDVTDRGRVGLHADADAASADVEDAAVKTLDHRLQRSLRRSGVVRRPAIRHPCPAWPQPARDYASTEIPDSIGSSIMRPAEP